MIDELAKYVDDGRMLIKAPDVPYFRIPEGVEEILNDAFADCPTLREVDIPYTMEFWDERYDRIYAGIGPDVKVNVWDWPYPENCQMSEELKAEIANLHE